MPSVEDYPEPRIKHEADHTIYRGRNAQLWCAVPGCEEFDPQEKHEPPPFPDELEAPIPGEPADDEKFALRDKILEHGRQVAQQHVDELYRRLEAAQDHLRSLTPEKSPEEQQKHAEALQSIRARRAENERLATEVTEGYTDVEVAARVLNAINFSWTELDAGDDEGPYWKRLTPQAELFIKAGFLRQQIPYEANADESRRRAIELYNRSLDVALQSGLGPIQAHESAVLGTYEVGFLDGLYQRQKESK